MILRIDSLKTALENEHSKQLTSRIVKAVEENPKIFKLLMEIVFGDNQKLSARGAWAMSYCAEQNPATLAPYLPKLIRYLQDENRSQAVLRNVYRSFQFMQFSEEFEGTLIELAFEDLQSAESEKAVKVFAMQTLYNLSLKYPEIRNELKLHIESQLPYQSAGFKSRGNKILKLLDKRRFHF